METDNSATGESSTQVRGLSDLLLGVRYGIWQKALVVAVEGKLEIPTGYTVHTDQVRLGSGNLNGQLRALVGGGLPLPFGNYIDAGFSFRIRGGPWDNDLMANLSVGVEAVENLWLRVGGSGTFHLGDSDDQAGSLDASYVGVGGAITYLFDFGLGLEVGASGDVWGENTFAGWGMEFVIQYQLGGRS